MGTGEKIDYVRLKMQAVLIIVFADDSITIVENESMGHNHQPDSDFQTYSRSFAIGIVLNVGFVAIEAFYGIYAGSLALIADAGHNLSDVASLLLAWGATYLATKAATEQRTYGLGKATVIASLVSALLLLLALGGIAWEAIGRFLAPRAVPGATVIVVASIGVVINTLTALLFIKGQKHDLNIRGAFLHMAADAGVSLGVVFAGILLIKTDWYWLDPVVSLIIVLIIFIGTWGLLRDSFNYAVDAVPKNIDIDGIKRYFMSFDHVTRIHDLHVWPLSTTRVALTVHLVVNHEMLDNTFLKVLQEHLHNHFGIEHSTFQIETGEEKDICGEAFHQKAP